LVWEKNGAGWNRFDDRADHWKNEYCWEYWTMLERERERYSGENGYLDNLSIKQFFLTHPG
jgi:hypothetical protein